MPAKPHLKPRWGSAQRMLHRPVRRMTEVMRKHAENQALFLRQMKALDGRLQNVQQRFSDLRVFLHDPKNLYKTQDHAWMVGKVIEWRAFEKQINDLQKERDELIIGFGVQDPKLHRKYFQIEDRLARMIRLKNSRIGKALRTLSIATKRPKILLPGKKKLKFKE